KHHRKSLGAVDLAVDSRVRGKIHAFDHQRIAQAETDHAAGSEFMPGLARLGQYDETSFRIERLDEPAVTKTARPPAGIALRAIFGSIDVTAGSAGRHVGSIHFGNSSGSQPIFCASRPARNDGSATSANLPSR